MSVASGQFQAQQVGSGPGGVHDVADLIDKVRLRKMTRADVDGQAPVRCCITVGPLYQLLTRCLQHPLSQRMAQATVFGLLQESTRRHQAAALVLPAQQGFGTLRVPSGATMNWYSSTNWFAAKLRRSSCSSAACASALACMVGSKKRKPLRPLDLAWYMATSAFFSRSSVLSCSPWNTTMPGCWA